MNSFGTVRKIIPEKKTFADIVFYAVCILSVILFYFHTCKSGIVTHDELAGITSARLGRYFENFSFGRWGGIINIIPNYLQAVSGNIWIYRIFTVSGLLFSVFFFTAFLRKIFGIEISRIFFLVFFLFATFEPEHDGLFAFSWTYQIFPGIVFLSLLIFCIYLEKENKLYRNISAAVYLIACMSYEASIPYGFIFFIVSVFFRSEKGRLKIRQLFDDLIVHFGLAVLYAASWIAAGLLSGGERGDATLSAELSLKAFYIVVLKIAIGLFPLNYKYFSPVGYILESFKLSPHNIIRFIFIILTGIIVMGLFKKAKPVSLTVYIKCSIFCLSGMLLSGVLCGISGRMIELLYQYGVKSYGTSYYSYFFLILWIILTGKYIYGCVKWKNAVLVFGGICLVFISEFIALGNEVQIGQFHENEIRYELFDDLIGSDEFGKTPAGTEIFTEDYMGIHGKMESLSEYANGIAGTDISFVNGNPGTDNYYLEYDAEKRILRYYLPDADGNKLIIYEKSYNSGLEGMKN